MKHLFLLWFLLITVVAGAQKYALLDERFSQPIHYSDQITSADKFNGFFPIEKKLLPDFLNALKEINKKLSSKAPFGQLDNYEMGCVKFTGSVTFSAGVERMDYVATSACDNIKISLHLSDAKKSNASNAFIVKVWIRYIEQNLKNKR